MLLILLALDYWGDQNSIHTKSHGCSVKMGEFVEYHVLRKVGVEENFGFRLWIFYCRSWISFWIAKFKTADCNYTNKLDSNGSFYSVNCQFNSICIQYHIHTFYTHATCLPQNTVSSMLNCRTKYWTSFSGSVLTICKIMHWT